jgi:formylglycine-generating enzyme required for sulfatase activity
MVRKFLAALVFLSIFSSVFANDSITVWLQKGVTLSMVKIPAGTFMMGNTDSVHSPWNTCDWTPPCDKPLHSVTIPNDFYMGKFEITNRQWGAMMDSVTSFWKGPDYAAEQISWNDCQAFVDSLNTLNNGVFRIPTEAEWEYACRAGTTTRFYFGQSNCTPESANCPQLDSNAWWGGNDPGSVQPVGLKNPNPWGLYDMLGNVYEWCQDDYSINGYGQNPPSDGSAFIDTTNKNPNKMKITRGAWRGYNEARRYTSYFHSGHDRTMRHDCCGLRIARDNSTIGVKKYPISIRIPAFKVLLSGGKVIVTFAANKAGFLNAVPAIMDVSGRTIFSHMQRANIADARTIRYEWLGFNDQGQKMAPGVYFVRLGDSFAGSFFWR